MIDNDRIVLFFGPRERSVLVNLVQAGIFSAVFVLGSFLFWQWFGIVGAAIALGWFADADTYRQALLPPAMVLVIGLIVLLLA